MTRPYFDDGTVQLYLGDCRKILPDLDITADLVVTDPPYGETKLPWDAWPEGWVAASASVGHSMWCFGSMRMFGEKWTEFTAAEWCMSQDVVWEKNAGTNFAADRFRRIHENAVHWYRGTRWGEIYHEAQHIDRPITDGRMRQVGGSLTRQSSRGEHLGAIGRKTVWTETGTRIATSILRAKNLRGRAIHPTEKPVDLLRPLIEYGCPPGALVLDLFAGSGAVLDAARQTGRRAIGIEGDEKYAERAAKRLSQGVLDLGDTA